MVNPLSDLWIVAEQEGNAYLLNCPDCTWRAVVQVGTWEETQRSEQQAQEALARHRDDAHYDWPELDPGIRRAVRVMRAGGVETFESCEGGPGHAYPEPTVRFYGTEAAGWAALAVILDHDLPIKALRRTWPYTHGAPTGPYWEVTFRSVS